MLILNLAEKRDVDMAWRIPVKGIMLYTYCMESIIFRRGSVHKLEAFFIQTI